MKEDKKLRKQLIELVSKSITNPKMKLVNISKNQGFGFFYGNSLEFPKNKIVCRVSNHTPYKYTFRVIDKKKGSMNYKDTDTISKLLRDGQINSLKEVYKNYDSVDVSETFSYTQTYIEIHFDEDPLLILKSTRSTKDIKKPIYKETLFLKGFLNTLMGNSHIVEIHGTELSELKYTITMGKLETEISKDTFDVLEELFHNCYKIQEDNKEEKEVKKLKDTLKQRLKKLS